MVLRKTLGKQFRGSKRTFIHRIQTRSPALNANFVSSLIVNHLMKTLNYNLQPSIAEPVLVPAPAAIIAAAVSNDVPDVAPAQEELDQSTSSSASASADPNMSNQTVIAANDSIKSAPEAEVKIDERQCQRMSIFSLSRYLLRPQLVSPHPLLPRNQNNL